jgi:hypothetical protein
VNSSNKQNPTMMPNIEQQQAVLYFSSELVFVCCCCSILVLYLVSALVLLINIWHYSWFLFVAVIQYLAL